MKMTELCVIGSSLRINDDLAAAQVARGCILVAGRDKLLKECHSFPPPWLESWPQSSFSEWSWSFSMFLFSFENMNELKKQLFFFP